jgi:hypothetical protein
MRKYFIKTEDSVWPTVIWQGTRLVVYYLGDDPDDVHVKETRGIDFDELLLHIDRGGSVFITTKPVEETPADKTEKLGNIGVEIDPHWAR